MSAQAAGRPNFSARQLTLSVGVGLDIPQRILPGGVLVARHLVTVSLDPAMIKRADLLLLVRPVGQLDLVREEVTPAQNMPESELRPQGPELMPSLSIPFALGLRSELDNKVVIRVSGKAVSCISLLSTVSEIQLTLRTHNPILHSESPRR